MIGLIRFGVRIGVRVATRSLASFAPVTGLCPPLRAQKLTSFAPMDCLLRRQTCLPAFGLLIGSAISQ